MVNESEYVNVFSKKFTGGPLNLGDPEDKTLRHVEEIFIKKLLQDRAHHEMCHDFVQKWGKCMEENTEGWKGALTFLTCRKPLSEMNECLSRYYTDKSFYEECKNMYLEKRANYRRTGIIEKDKYHKKKYYESEFEANLKKYVESTKTNKQQESNK